MKAVSALYAVALSVLLAQDFAFDLAGIQRGPRKLERAEIQEGPVHRFPQSSFRSFKVVGEGRFRTFKQTAGDVKQLKEELVYLAPNHDTDLSECTEQTTVEEIVVEVVVEEDEQGVLGTIVENVRNAFDDYVAPLLGNGITSDSIGEAARSALDWISRSIWGTSASKLTKNVAGRLAFLKLDTDTGDVMVVKAKEANVKVVRIDKVVFDAEEEVLGEAEEMSVSMFRFEPGDLVIAGSQSFFEGVGHEQMIKALSVQNRSLGNKADALVKASPKQTKEESFLLSVFE